MAVYKVLQDIEAEDKLVGPLTLKQFIFAIIAIGCIFLAVVFARINIALAAPWLLPITLFGFLAAPLNRDQPNDIWIAARIRFLIKPRTRIWNQSGMIDLVQITAPKKELLQPANSLNPHEVHSRLRALASTMDSRGWAVKNVNINLFAQPDYMSATNSDRLVSISDIAQEVPNADVMAADDIMDPMSNMIAQRFDNALQQQQGQRLANLRQNLAPASPMPAAPATAPADYDFITNQGSVEPGYTTFGDQIISPGSHRAAEDTPVVSKHQYDKEEAILQQHHKQAEASTAHLHHELPTTSGAPSATIKELSQSGSDLTVAAVASIAKHAEEKAILKANDVISLH